MKALCIYTLISYRVSVLTNIHEEFEFKYTTTKMLSMGWIVVILIVVVILAVILQLCDLDI